MTNIALIESKTSRTNWEDRFDNNFEIERFALCSDHTKKKILKADVDIEINIPVKPIFLLALNYLLAITRLKSELENKNNTQILV